MPRLWAITGFHYRQRFGRGPDRLMTAARVIGIDFDYEVMGETNGMMMVAVSGTAVKLG